MTTRAPNRDRRPTRARTAHPGRATAALVLVAVLRDGRSMTDLLQPGERLSTLSPGERSHIVAMVYGSLRHWSRLEAQVQRFLGKPLRGKDMDILALLVAAAYEMASMHTPVHAVVNEAVACSRALGKPWASALVNAVLRRLAAVVDEPLTGLADDPSDIQAVAIATSHPPWLVAQLARDYPGDFMQILGANNQTAPMTLRVNLAHSSRDTMLGVLLTAGFRAQPGRHSDAAIVLETPADVQALPGFADGLLSVQDEAAQLSAIIASAFLANIDRSSVLDACAAPGGKALAIVERCSSARVDAVDIDVARARRITENLERMPAGIGERVHVRIADARGLTSVDAGPYDLILADVPCSGTGVIRRHPDIKWLRKEGDIASLVQCQREIVNGLWPLLKRNGILVYATCSVLMAENADQIAHLSRELPGCQTLPMPSSLSGLLQRHGPKAADLTAHPPHPGLQILPGESGMDGFFYAILKKTPQPDRSPV